MIKHICDCCKKEVKNLKELYTINFLSNMRYMNDGSLDEIYKDLCKECYIEYQLTCEKLFYKMAKD